MLASRLVFTPPEDSLLYVGEYDYLLVVLSVTVAIIASYASLLVAQKAGSNRQSRSRAMWISVGGICLGAGIWTMHFVGMLAFSLPCSTSYDVGLTFLSMAPGILASLMVVWLMSGQTLRPSSILLGGLLLGTGIGSMHYSGMEAMRLNGLVRYDATLFALSILVAVSLATLAFWIRSRLTSKFAASISGTVATSVVMGLAVSGMHYTAMAAAYFIRSDQPIFPVSGVSTTFLAAILLVSTSLLIVVTIVATYVSDKAIVVKRSVRWISLLIISWTGISWVASDNYYDKSTLTLYQHEMQTAERQVENSALTIDRDVAFLKGVSEMISNENEVRELLQNSRELVNRSPKSLAQRARTPLGEILDQNDHELNVIAQSLKVGLIFILDNGGDCIVASNAGQPGSPVGSNFADRQYFQENREGRPGRQYAVGRTTNVPGLYYSAPVLEKGKYLGSVVVKRNITDYAEWLRLSNAFIVDSNGVVVLAADKRLEQRLMPGAAALLLSPAQLLAQYKRVAFGSLSPYKTQNGQIRLIRLDANDAPSVLVSKSLAEDAISIGIARPLEQIRQLDSERGWMFVLITTAGSMLIIAVSAIALYLRISRQTESALRIAATAFETQEGILVTDAATNILRVNSAFTTITGYTADEAIGNTPALLKSDRQDKMFYDSMWASINETGFWSGEIWNRRKNGEVFPEQLTITAVRDEGGSVTNYVASLSDISSRKQSEEQILRLAFYDQLTGLPNRRLLLDRLAQDIKKSRRNGRSLAVLFIDLDRFKEINDTLGHTKGDKLLIEAAGRIRKLVRETDTLARLGGDEFTLILPDYDGPTHIDRIAEYIVDELDRPFDLGDGDFGHISGSVGITRYPEDARDIDELLKHADQAMYAAKAAGRSRFSHFTPALQQAAQEKMAVTRDLRQALSNHELEVFYQPIVELGTGIIQKAEALLRWRHPTRGMVSPAVFIPLAEEFGLIHDIGNWVFLQAVASISNWKNQFGLTIQISVNRSPVEFTQGALGWEDTLRAANLPGAAICMEITEGLLVKESTLVQETLMACRTSGIEVSVDDFGTGYSALSYLKRFDVDYLKIDQSFVKSLINDESDKAMVEAIIVMAHKLRIKTIAEGVETEAQRDLLLSFGCDFAQGYLYSKPIPASEFEKLLAG